MSGLKTKPPEISSCQQKRQNYKLLVDPALKKGEEKIYRIDGVVPGHEFLYPPVQLRDPRLQLSALQAKTKVEGLVVPRFKIDKNYVGKPSPVQVTIYNLNDNVNKQFLDDMLKKFGAIEESQIFYHPKTRKHLRLAHATFATTQSAKLCIEKLNNTSVMGDVLTVYLDPFGKDCHRIFEDSISGKSQTGSSFVKEKDKTVVGVPHSSSAELLTTLTDKSLSTSQSSEKCFSELGSCDSASTSSVYIGLGHTSSNKLGNLLKSHQKNSGWDRKPLSPCGEVLSSWKGNSSPAWDDHNREKKKHVTSPSTAVSLLRESPIRESLDSRIKLLLKQADAESGFLDRELFSQFDDSQILSKSDERRHPPVSDPKSINTAPPLPPDSLPPLPKYDEPPPPPPDEDNGELLSNPHPPFSNVSGYNKWDLRTQDIDKGLPLSLPAHSKNNDSHSDVSCVKNLPPDDSQWRSITSEKTSDVQHVKGDCTPVLDEPLDIYEKQRNTTLLQGINHEMQRDSDDKMSLSSLSSPDDKVEVNAPSVVVGNLDPSGAMPVRTSNNLSYSQSQATSSTFSPLHLTQSVTPLYPMAGASQYSFSVYPTVANSSSGYATRPPPPNIYAASPSAPFPTQSITPNPYSNIPLGNSITPVSYSAADHSVPALHAPPPPLPPSRLFLPVAAPLPSQKPSSVHHPLPVPPPPPHTFLPVGAPLPPQQLSSVHHALSGPPPPSHTFLPAASSSYSLQPSSTNSPLPGPHPPSHTFLPAVTPSHSQQPSSAHSPLPGLPPPPHSFLTAAMPSHSQHPSSGHVPLPGLPPPPHSLPTAAAPSHSQLPSSVHHPMYPGEQVQRVAETGAWRAGVVSTVSASANNPSKIEFSGQAYPQNYHTRLSPGTQIPGLYSAASPHFPSLFSSLVSKPPPGYPLMSTSKNPEATSQIKVETVQEESSQLHLKNDPKISTVNSVLESVVKELKQVMKKDLCKRIIQASAFKSFEKWWDVRYGKSQVTVQTDSALLNKETERPKMRAQSALNALLSKNSNSSSFGFGLYGIGLGLRATMPKMPSFKKKTVKQSSPPPQDDDDSNHHLIKQAAEYSGTESLTCSGGEESSDQYKSSSEDSVSETEESALETETDEEAEEEEEESGEEDDVCEDNVSPVTRKSDADKVHILEEVDVKNDKDEREDASGDRASPFDSITENEGKIERVNICGDVCEPADLKKEEEASELDTLEVVDKNYLEISVYGDAETLEGAFVVPPVKENELLSEASVNEDSQTIKASKALASGNKDFSFSEFSEKDGIKTQLVTDGDKTPVLDSIIDSSSISVKDSDGLSNDFQNIKVCEDDEASDLAKINSCVLQLLSEHNYSIPGLNYTREFFQENEKLSTVDSVVPGPVYPKYTKPPCLPPVKTSETDDVPDVEEKRQRRKRKRHSQHHYEPVVEQQRRTFDKRNIVEEMNILFEFTKTGIGQEDVDYLKKSCKALIQDEKQLSWMSDTHWVDHPRTLSSQSPPKKKKKYSECTRIHNTGSARTEGYYKIDVKDRDVLSCRGSTTDVNSKGDMQDPLSRAKANVQASKEARSNQRRLLTALGETDSTSDLLKFNQLKFRKKHLAFARSRIHDWGLFALEPIAADEMIIEYVGQMVRPVIADLREAKYAELGIGSSYLFRVDRETIIDSTKCGNLSRFINHSCNPNCYAKIVTVEGQKKIVIYSKQPINANEEITYDYKFPIEDEKIPCRCGAPQCRKYLN